MNNEEILIWSAVGVMLLLALSITLYVKIYDKRYKAKKAKEEGWMVIGTDNLNREYVSDMVYRSNLSERTATEVAVLKNKNGEHNAYYYKAVPSDYKLHDAYEDLR